MYPAPFTGTATLLQTTGQLYPAPFTDTATLLQITGQVYPAPLIGTATLLQITIFLNILLVASLWVLHQGFQLVNYGFYMTRLAILFFLQFLAYLLALEMV